MQYAHTHKGVQSFKRTSEQSCYSSTSREGGTRTPFGHFSGCFEHVQPKGAPEVDPAPAGGIRAPWCSQGGAGGEDGLGLPPEPAACATRSWINAGKQRTEWSRSVAGEAQKPNESLNMMSRRCCGWSLGLWLRCAAVTREGRDTTVNSRCCNVMISRWCYNSTHIWDASSAITLQENLTKGGWAAEL